MAIGLEGIGEIVTEGADMGRRESRRRARVGGAFGSGADGGLGDDERSAEGIIEEEDEVSPKFCFPLNFYHCLSCFSFVGYFHI